MGGNEGKTTGIERTIVIGKGFNKSVESLLLYLENKWLKNIADSFSRQLEVRVEHIVKYPETGMPAKKKGVRSMPVGKHNRIYCSLNSKTIRILLLRDMRMNPRSNPTKNNLCYCYCLYLLYRQP